MNIPLNMLLFLGLFFVDAGVHLFACYCEKESLRKYTKLLLMPLLLLCVLVTVKFESVVFIALIASSFGDYFMLYPKKSVHLGAGLMCFLLAITAYLTNAAGKIYYSEAALYILIGVVVFVGGALGVYFKIKNNLKEHRFTVLIYTLALSTFVCAAFVYMMCVTTPQTIMLFSGALLFLISDAILSQSIFVKDFSRRDFFIMLPYIAAQFLITLSLITLPT